MALTGSRLVLGGHSFIQQLGSDPLGPPEEQVSIVEACLDAGITWFDTTYLPERAALGRALERLGRRREATIIAWNFFVDFGPGEEVGGPAHYQPHHITQMLGELRTDYIDCLVVHALGNAAGDRRQEELAVRWKEQGLVKRLGVWHPGADAEQVYGRSSPYSFMVRPYNVTTADAAPAFAACKRLGWETLACSPFVRGWELDKRAESARASSGEDADAVRARLADHMLRYALFAPGVDRLVVAMRRPDWVSRNLESERRGMLSAGESAWLSGRAG